MYAKNLLTDHLAQGELSDAVPLLTVLHDAQFNPESRADVLALGRLGRGVDPRMDLRWSWLLIVGVLGLAIAVLIAWRLPVAKAQRRMRPLANVSRLTRLPASSLGCNAST